jgi:hypothetical protein
MGLRDSSAISSSGDIHHIEKSSVEVDSLWGGESQWDDEDWTAPKMSLMAPTSRTASAPPKGLNSVPPIQKTKSLTLDDYDVTATPSDIWSQSLSPRQADSHE